MLFAAKRSTLLRGSVLAAAGAAVLVLPACSAASSNAFVEPLNNFQKTVNEVTGTAATPEAFQSSLTANLPKLESEITAMQSAQTGLPDNLAPIANTCISLGQGLVTNLQAISAAASAESQEDAQAAASKFESDVTTFTSQCIDAYNNANK